MSKVTGAQFDANAHAALTAFFNRSGIGAVEMSTPFLELLKGELESPATVRKLRERLEQYQAFCARAEASQQPVDFAAAQDFYEAHGVEIVAARELEAQAGQSVSDYDIRQRMDGVRIFYHYLTAKGWHPAQMLRQIIAVGRALHVSPWSEMSMDEIGVLMSETKAAHSHRCKLLSGEIKRSGQAGIRMPGQKTEAAAKTYKKIRRGNTSRKGGKKFIQNKTKKTP